MTATERINKIEAELAYGNGLTRAESKFLLQAFNAMREAFIAERMNGTDDERLNAEEHVDAEFEAAFEELSKK